MFVSVGCFVCFPVCFSVGLVCALACWFVGVLVCWRVVSGVLLCHCVVLFSVVLVGCCCVGASNDTAAVAVAMLLAVFAQPRFGIMKTAALIRA